MTTISTSTTLGIVLNPASYTNPIVFEAGVTISNSGGDAVAVSGSSYFFAVQNYGVIVGTGPAFSTGVHLRPGGSLTNAQSGFIGGVQIAGGNGTVVNDGVMTDVNLFAGGSVTNSTNAFMTGGGDALVIGSVGVGTVTNAGIIASTGSLGKGGDGVFLSSGGSVTNAPSAVIAGVSSYKYFTNGVLISGRTGTVVNGGTIAVTGTFNNAGVDLQSGGLVANAANASITGYTGVLLFVAGTVINDGSIVSTGTSSAGVDLTLGGTLTNAGTIIGNSGTAVNFGGSGNDLLVLDPGFGFSGAAIASASASNTLELAPGASAGSAMGLGTEIINFGPIVFDAGAEWSISGDTSGLAGIITGFTVADTIVVTGVTAIGSSYVGGVLTLDEEGGGSATLNLPGAFTLANFDVTPGVSNGTEVTFVACFAAGTRIQTADGEVSVEKLHVGGQIGTLNKRRLTRIVWLGHRHIDCGRYYLRPTDLWPVRIRANAFGDGLPARDLLLSPDHAVFVGGVLVPVRHLINGCTVVQERVDEVTYYHVELATHDVILAEGLPCESYLDTGNRVAFANGGAETLHGEDDLLTVASTSYAPAMARHQG